MLLVVYHDKYDGLDVIGYKAHTTQRHTQHKGPNGSSLYTDIVLFFFSSFSKTSASKPTPTSTPLRWRSILKSPAVIIFYHARLTDFEEKIEGLWTG